MGSKSLLSFLVFGLLPAPFAEFFELDFFSYEFLVFAGPVIYPFANRAGKFYKSILGHANRLI
jgi:hypothetical protein